MNSEEGKGSHPVEHPINHPRLNKTAQSNLDTMRERYAPILEDGSYGKTDGPVDVVVYLGYLGIGMVQLDRVTKRGAEWIAGPVLDMDLNLDGTDVDYDAPKRVHTPLALIAQDKWLTVSVPVYGQLVESAIREGIHLFAAESINSERMRDILDDQDEMTDEELLRRTREHHPDVPDDAVITRVQLPSGLSVGVVTDPALGETMERLSEAMAAPSDEFAIPQSGPSLREFIESKTGALHDVMQITRAIHPYLGRYVGSGYYGARPMDTPTPESVDLWMNVTPSAGTVDFCAHKSNKGQTFLETHLLDTKHTGICLGVPAMASDEYDSDPHPHVVCSVVVLPIVISDAETAGIVIYNSGPILVGDGTGRGPFDGLSF